MSFIQRLVITTSFSAMICALASCGGGGGDGTATPSGSGSGNSSAPAALVMPGVRLGVKRQSQTTLLLSSPDAANVASVVVLSGANWDSAVPCPVTTQTDGTWLASMPVAQGANLMFRLVLADGNIVESSVEASGL